MKKPNVTAEEMSMVVKLYDAAMLEVARNGVATSVKCSACGSVINIHALSSTAWRLRCSCGKYNDTLKRL